MSIARNQKRDRHRTDSKYNANSFRKTFRVASAIMQTVLQSQMHVSASSSKQSVRSPLDGSRIGSVTLPLRRRFFSGSSLTATRAQQRRYAGAGRSHGLCVRAEKVIMTPYCLSICCKSTSLARLITVFRCFGESCGISAE